MAVPGSAEGSGAATSRPRPLYRHPGGLERAERAIITRFGAGGSDEFELWRLSQASYDVLDLEILNVMISCHRLS